MVCWIAYSDGKRCRVSSFCCVCAQFCYTARIEQLDVDSDARYYPKQYSTHDILRGSLFLQQTGCPANNKRLMPQLLKTLLNRTYEVQTPVECTVTNSVGTTILTAYPGTPVQFVADGKMVTLSADAATLYLVEGKSTVSAGDSGGETATGEPVENLNSGVLQMKHATWFENTEQTSINVLPAPWKNEVMTCYLKTTAPVILSGVMWLDDAAPTMESGYTYFIAIQQIAPATIVANLAYSLLQ